MSSKKSFMRYRGLVYFILPAVMFLVAPSKVPAKKIAYSPLSSMVEVKNRTMKHFDRDKDGWLNRYENSLLTTHLKFGYDLVKKNKQKPYDFNHDLMLEPFEKKMYLKDKKNGVLKKYDRATEKKSIVYRRQGK
ncbi:MAG: hypothetical protein HQM16_14950 [Deltaproteobacteria bacterium]|nr:hypothetical protein [Deltaproteobacteria bacterium]